MRDLWLVVSAKGRTSARGESCGKVRRIAASKPNFKIWECFSVICADYIIRKYDMPMDWKEEAHRLNIVWPKVARFTPLRPHHGHLFACFCRKQGTYKLLFGAQDGGLGCRLKSLPGKVCAFDPSLNMEGALRTNGSMRCVIQELGVVSINFPNHVEHELSKRFAKKITNAEWRCNFILMQKHRHRKSLDQC